MILETMQGCKRRSILADSQNMSRATVRERITQFEFYLQGLFVSQIAFPSAKTEADPGTPMFSSTGALMSFMLF